MQPDHAWAVAVSALCEADITLYADASRDHNPLHLDREYARGAGHETVIAHGMLGAGFLSSFIEEKFPGGFLKEFSVRFHNAVHLGVPMKACGTIERIEHVGPEIIYDVSFCLTNAESVLTSGTAVVVVRK